MVVLNACVLAYWLARNVNFAELMREIDRIPPKAVILAMTMNTAVLSFYALRLSTILGKSVLACFVITTVGFTFNALIPFRAGEGVKIYLGKSYYQFAVGSLLAAIVMEKLYDAGALAVLTMTLGATAERRIVGFKTSAVLAAIAAIGVGIALLARAKGLRRLLALLDFRIVKALRLDALLASATAIAGHNAARAAVFTLSIWLTNVCLVFVAFRALLPGADFDVFGAMTVLLIGALAIAVPASPAGLGVFEAGIVAYLMSAHGVEKERALSAVLAYHFSITAPHSLFAILFLAIGLWKLSARRRSA